MSGQGLYLFAIARGLDPASLDGVTGMRGAPLVVVRQRGLDVVACSVDLDEFGEAALTRNLEDLEWLEVVARTHDDVVRAVHQHATSAPLRLVTICSDDDSTRSRVDEWYDELVVVLDRIEGRHEWSVKAYARRQTPPTPVGVGASESGAEYLRRKRSQAAERRAATEDDARAAEEMHDSLAAHAVASRRLPAQDPRLTGRAGTMLLNGAYLVTEGGGEEFISAAAEIERRHPLVEIEVQGPWPPYSFAVLG